MTKFITGIPLLVTLLLYYKIRKDLYRDYGNDIMFFKTQELHKKSQGIVENKPFYETWLFSLPQRIPSEYLIIVGAIVFAVSWFLS